MAISVALAVFELSNTEMPNTLFSLGEVERGPVCGSLVIVMRPFAGIFQIAWTLGSAS